MLRDFVFDNNNLEGNITAIIDSIYDRSTVRKSASRYPQLWLEDHRGLLEYSIVCFNLQVL